jgi:hypothetical protein
MARVIPSAVGAVRGGLIGEIDKELHDLCQPLTTLQCRLEMAVLVGSPEAYREGVEEGLAECQRIIVAVRMMRAAMQRSSDGSLTAVGGAAR